MPIDNLGGEPPRGVIIAYDLCLGHLRDRQIGFVKKNNSEKSYDVHLGEFKDYWKGVIKENTIEKGLHHAFIYGLPQT